MDLYILSLNLKYFQCDPPPPLKKKTVEVNIDLLEKKLLLPFPYLHTPFVH